MTNQVSLPSPYYTEYITSPLEPKSKNIVYQLTQVQLLNGKPPAVPFRRPFHRPMPLINCNKFLKNLAISHKKDPTLD
jgi:hypothetical protein